MCVVRLKPLSTADGSALAWDNRNPNLTGLPVPPTDSVFAVVVEELGWFGAVGLIALYGCLVWRGLVIARRAPDMLGTLLASGLAVWIALEALVNMAVMVGLLPFAGNALPFISAGGSNLVATLAALGILFNISRQRGEGTISDDEWRSYSAVVNLRWWNGRRGVSRARRSKRTNQSSTRTLKLFGLAVKAAWKRNS